MCFHCIGEKKQKQMTHTEADMWASFDAARMELEATSGTGCQWDVSAETRYVRAGVLLKKYRANQLQLNPSFAINTVPSVEYLEGQAGGLFGTCRDGHHSCDENCEFMSLEAGEEFESGGGGGIDGAGTYLVASGSVFVCMESGATHVCDDTCDKAVLCYSKESHTCPISKRVKSGVISQCISTGGEEEGIPAPSSKRARHGCEDRTFSRRHHKEEINQDVADSIAFNKQLDEASCMCRILLCPKFSGEVVEKKLARGEQTALAHIKKYVERCGERGRQPDVLEMFAIHARFNVSKYAQFSTHFYGEAMGERYIRERAELVVQAWHILCKTPNGVDSKPRLFDCQVPLLYKLSEGFVSHVVVHHTTHRVFGFNVKKAAEVDTYASTVITFIPKCDVRPTTEDTISNVETKANHGNRGGRRQRKQRRGPDRQEYKSRNVYAHPMRNFHILNECYKSLLLGNFTLEELQDFVLHVPQHLLQDTTSMEGV